MKNTIKLLAAAAALLLATAAHAAESVRKSFDLKGFDSIEMTWVFDVELVRSDTYSVDVEVSDDLLDYLEVKVIGSTLHLGVEKLPKALTSRRNWDPTVKAVIGLPELKRLSMSGATSCRTSGKFETAGSFKVRLSGACKLNGLQAEAGTFDLQCSGASNFKIDGTFRQAELNMSGASKGSLSLAADNISIKASGANEASGEIDCKKLDISSSGASKLKFSGRADEESADCSGACEINLASVKAKTADIELSGSSNCRADAEDRLTVELSGASSCRYVRHSGLDLHIISISRGASLKEMK